MKVMIVMGSSSDWDVMKGAQETLEKFGVEYEKKVVSAHRMPHELSIFAKYCEDNGFHAMAAWYQPNNNIGAADEDETILVGFD